jgi:hypothetical protein
MTHKYLEEKSLERWSFLWSEVRLLIAAVALFIGGVPPLLYMAVNAPELAETLVLVLKVSYLISGVTAAYLLYRWVVGGRVLLGRKNNMLDTVAFLVMTVSGINLGLVPLIGKNIGLSYVTNPMVLVVVAVIYIATAIYMFQRWQKHNDRLFS